MVEKQVAPENNGGWSHYVVPGPNEAAVGRLAVQAGQAAGQLSGVAPAREQSEQSTYRRRPAHVVRVARSRGDSATGDDDLSAIPYNTYGAYKLAGELQPDAGRDRVRTWSVITAGALAGVLFVMAGFLLLQLQRRSQELSVIAAQGRAQSAVAPVGASNSSAAGLPRQARVGYYPPDFTLSTLDGKSVKLSDLKGKPLWVNFWATWCPPCRAEMPDMKQKYARFKDKGLVILGVDMSEDPGTVKQFVEGNGYNWTFLLDSGGQVASQYYITAIPTHLFIGSDGIIKAMQIGGIPSSMMDRYLSQIVQ